MIAKRLAIGLGLGTLLAIAAASTALDLKSRDDEAWVDHTLGVLQKASDLRILLREAEADSRGFALTNAATFRAQFSEASEKVPSAYADLLKAVSDNPDQAILLASVESLIHFRLERSAELISLSAAGDTHGFNAATVKTEGRAAMDTVIERLERFTSVEKQLLAIRSDTSRKTGTLLLAVDLAGVALVLGLGGMLFRGAYRDDILLRASLSRSEAEAMSLGAKAQEQHQHLLAAHEEARQTAEVLQSTFNSMTEGVLIVDANDQVLFSNPATERILGYEPGKELTQVRAELDILEADGVTPIPPRQLPTPRTLRGESFDRAEVVVRPKIAPKHRPGDGNEFFRLLISGRPLRNASGEITGAAMIYHDITAGHETERLLQQAQKLDAIGKLTGGVAHDFNNMLTIITGTIETLIDDLADRPEAAATASLISQAADRCAELIRHLLAFARKQPLHPRDTDVNGTVFDIAKLLRPTLGEQIEINSILEEDTMVAHIDSAQLANSLVNMAINARDAMPSGGKLLLETRKVILDEAYAQANPGLTPGHYIMLAVSDTGTGMPPEVRDRAFEPFFTTKEAGKGSGLGLSMVYGFVKQSGGNIKIYSEEGRGTTVRLYLPPAKGIADTRPVADAPLPRGIETIFVVEDDQLVQNFVVTQLHSLGYQTITASTAAEALMKITTGESFDLLFTDVIMPGGMNGEELADEVSRFRPDTKVLYTSGYTDNAMIEHGRLDHGALLLTKPYRRTELAQIIRQALGDQPKPIAPASGT